MLNSFFSLIPGATEYPPLQEEISALDGAAAYDDPAHYTAYIERFVDIISDPLSVSAELRNYLLTEGGNVAMDGIPLGVRHLLYWLDLKLKTKLRDEHELYTNRLSEAGAGWGSATPETLAEADPLDLVATLEGLGLHCVLIDNDAADDESQVSVDGCVDVGYRDGSAHPCYTIGGLTKSNNGSGGLYTDTNELAYEYKFWHKLDGFSEVFSGSPVKFPRLAVEVIGLVRHATDHQIAREIVLQKNAGDPECTRITITGYPGEFPEIRMGSSTSSGLSNAAGDQNDLDASVEGVGIASGGTARPAMITVSRQNVHFRNIDFVGNRDQAGGSGQIFASRIFRINTTATGGSIRHCKFTGTQFIRDDDPISGFDTLRDAVFGERSAAIGVDQCGGVDIFAPGYVFDSNRIEPVAVGDWPGDDIANYSTFAAVWLDVNADSVQVTRNKFTGVKINSMFRYGRSSSTIRDGAYIADNYFEVYDKNCIDVFSVSNSIIERNYCKQFAKDGISMEGGGAGIQVSHSTSTTIRHNVIVGVEPMLRVGGAINLQGGSFANLNVTVEGNIVYRGGITISSSGSTIASIAISRNLVAGMKEIRKTAIPADNAPLSMLYDLSGTLAGVVTYNGNQVWRFEDGTPDQETIETGAHLAIRDSATPTADFYAVTDSLTGWTNNFAAKPDWSDDPETGDMRLGSTTLDFPANMPFTPALSRAWEPQ